MTRDDTNEDRLIALETRMAHFERMAEDLSDMVVEQARSIDVLTAQIHRLRDRLAEAAVAERSPHDDQPPPHY
ncbi:SlyX protein [Paramagnetospirillum kuznetsovii]|uniref:SlyX protein n=1 Tax=Paramagnetospirillum kuznetsovii TaxID=2053833 RepID=A0A364NZ87_9PROT|nr:SlyX family protein [Paramagnetospirillum kuznetsovii]RAU22215.1 SlyX protein [Paramagnetospirillum kuznetsovii]